MRVQNKSFFKNLVRLGLGDGFSFGEKIGFDDPRISTSCRKNERGLRLFTKYCTGFIILREASLGSQMACEINAIPNSLAKQKLQRWRRIGKSVQLIRRHQLRRMSFFYFGEAGRKYEIQKTDDKRKILTSRKQTDCIYHIRRCVSVCWLI